MAKIVKKIAYYGRLYTVQAVFTSNKDANEYLNENKNTGVLCVRNGLIYIVNNKDIGISVK